MKRLSFLVVIIIGLLWGLQFYTPHISFSRSWFQQKSPSRTVQVSQTDLRTFTTSFEAVDEFLRFYITPRPHLNTTSHTMSKEQVHSGAFAHKAWVYAPNPPSTRTTNNNHRGYPTIQFQKTPKGVLRTPVEITFWVWLDIDLQAQKSENEWFSFATFTSDPSDTWKRTVLVNLSHDGFVHLMHVPTQGKAEYSYQNKTIKFPKRQWVKLRVYLDFDKDHGYAKVWQNDVLVSHARVTGTNGTLAQAHFGMYAAPSVSSGVVYNDDLTIREVAGE